MKDLEKIKSEDLGCQVQDANPGNFAIEQEVAQLVGATVPAPTEPSADDARELGAQLLVFLRRALLPIRSALRTALAAIYAHLDSRCTDYTPAAYASFTPTHHAYDPMGSTPRTLPNLLTALTAFSARKISNGSATADGIPDGTSLGHLLVNNSATEIKDDNHGYTLARSFPTSKFQSLKKLTLNASGYCNTRWIDSDSSLEELHIGIEHHGNARAIYQNSALKKLYADDLVDYGGWDYGAIFDDCENLEEIYMRGMTGRNTSSLSTFISNMPKLAKLVLGNWSKYDYLGYGSVITSCPLLIDLEFASVSIDLDLRNWNPTDKGTTFLQNFREHIALRLTANGSGLTLTLSQAVFDTIWNADGTPKSTDPDSVIYQINKIIKTDKHWSVNRA